MEAPYGSHGRTGVQCFNRLPTPCLGAGLTLFSSTLKGVLKLIGLGNMPLGASIFYC